METGIVKFFKPEVKANFGFIAADRGGPDVFFHFSQYTPTGEPENRLPKKGDRVEFTRVDSDTGPKARAWEFEPYVNMGDIAHGRLGDTLENGAHYFNGIAPYP